MKKLIIAAAIMAASVVANAASFNWTLTGVAATPDGTAAAADWAVYYLDASKYAGMATAEDIAAYVTSNYKYADETWVNGRAGVVASTQGTVGSYNQGDYESGFLVIFDADAPANAKYYAMTGVVDSDKVTAQLNDITTSFGTFASGTTGWQSIPEPTSGLLLLIGVAGLALRRRRA